MIASVQVATTLPSQERSLNRDCGEKEQTTANDCVKLPTVVLYRRITLSIIKSPLEAAPNRDITSSNPQVVLAFGCAVGPPGLQTPTISSPRASAVGGPGCPELPTGRSHRAATDSVTNKRLTRISSKTSLRLNPKRPVARSRCTATWCDSDGQKSYQDEYSGAVLGRISRW